MGRDRWNAACFTAGCACNFVFIRQDVSESLGVYTADIGVQVMQFYSRHAPRNQF
jgi:hypothetical protein